MVFLPPNNLLLFLLLVILQGIFTHLYLKIIINILQWQQLANCLSKQIQQSVMIGVWYYLNTKFHHIPNLNIIKMQNQVENPQAQHQNNKKHVRSLIINAIAIILIVPASIILLFYGSFVDIQIISWPYLNLNLNLFIIALYFLLQTVFGIINNCYSIPKFKKSAGDLPTVAIHIIGRGEEQAVLRSVLIRIRDQKYPQNLIKRTMLCVDDDENHGESMVKVFKQIFPLGKQLHLKTKFSQLSKQQREQLLTKHENDQYLIVTQPHGGRRQIKFTAFSFSTHVAEYVFHCDSDSLMQQNSLIEMCKTVSGYNQSHQNQRPCGGVVGQIRINNCLNYLALQMEISYWFAFYTGRAAQSLFKCVTTISGAMGLFHSQTVKNSLEDYQSQTFFKIKCVFGEDRHLTSSIIEKGSAVIFDPNAVAYTQTPLKFNDLMVQQGRWYKGFYRQTIVFLPKIFNYSCWSVITLMYSFFIPFLALITVITSMFQLQNLVFLMIYVFVATFLMSLRGIIRACKWRFLHSLWHPLFFFMAFLPLKIMALIYCLCGDSKDAKNRYKILVPIYVWIFAAIGVFIGMGIVFNIVVDEQVLNNWMKSCLYIMSIFLGMLCVHWLSWGMGVFVPKNRLKLKKMYGLADEKENAKDLQTARGLKPSKMGATTQQS